MNYHSIVWFLLFLLFPVFLKAQMIKVQWEKVGDIAASAISFSPDSSEILISSSENLEIRNAVTGNLVRKFEFSRIIESSAWSPNGDTLCVMTADSIYLLHARSRAILRVQPVYPRQIFRYSPDGTYLTGVYTVLKASNFSDVSDQFAKRPNSSGMLYPLHILPGDTTALQFRADDSLHLISIPGGKFLRHFNKLPRFSMFSPLILHSNSNRAVFVIKDTAFIFKTTDGEIVKKLSPWSDGGGEPLSFTSDGAFILFASGQKFILMNIQSGEKLEFSSNTAWPYSTRGAILSSSRKLFFKSNTNRLECSDNTKTHSVLKIYDLRNADWIISQPQGHESEIKRVEFLDNFTKLRSTSYDSLMLTWDFATGQLLKKEKTSTTDFKNFSLDSVISKTGRYRLKVRLQTGAELQLRDNKTDTLIRFLQGSYTFKDVTRLVFSDDERYVLASISKFPVSGKVANAFALYIWEVSTGSLIAKYDVSCYATQLAMTPDNRSIVWSTPTGRLIVFNTNGILTDIMSWDETHSELQPVVFPNPLRESGTISYSVSNPALLKISIHDIFGREMMVLKNEFTEPGNYTLPFKSSELSSGTYFLKITGGREASTTHFSLLR